jgi:arginase
VRASLALDHRTHSIGIIGAPSAIGIRPYASGEARHLDRAPGALRELGLVDRLDAVDLGDVVPPGYRDYLRPPRRARNEPEITAYSTALGERVATTIESAGFALVLGGDCSIVLGSLFGARRAAGGPVGLAYLDAHADFATPEESRTGSVASMSLGFAVGRGDTPLSHLGGCSSLVEGDAVALLGRRDAAEPWYGHAALAESPVLDLPDTALLALGHAEVARQALKRLTAPGLRGFWIHLDADVINPVQMSAVDSPVPGGPTLDKLVSLLGPLVRHPKALGMDLAIYDPALDPDRICAARLVWLLTKLLASPEQIR